MLSDWAAPQYIADHDTGDEHTYPVASAILACPECNAPLVPEPTDAERARILADPNYTWTPPERLYLRTYFGLAGGGYGQYLCCDRCDWFHKP